MESKTPLLSIVTSVYRSEQFVNEFLSRLYAVIQDLGVEQFEIIVVNDGSPDDSLALLQKLKSELYPEIIILDLSRNFGHHHALMAGLSFCKGERVCLIDCDLETPPEFLAELYRKMEGSDYDSVYGYQESRKGGWFERWSGDLYWKMFNYLSDVEVPANIVTARVMCRNYVNALLELGDRNLFLAGLFHWVGFKQIGVRVERSQREGKSTYTIRKRIELLVNSVTSFSAYPLVLIFRLGLSITFISIIFGSYLIIYKLFNQEVLSGWTSLAVMLIFSVGILTTCLGVIGIYLSKLFTQTQNRPLFLVRNIY